MHKIVDVGAETIEVWLSGEGTPTVAILPGMMCSLYDWIEVISGLEKSLQVLLVHRAGCGESDYTGIGTTGEAADKLYKTLQQLKIIDPIVLVGHSYGGLCAQHFTVRYPSKVAGLILVDSTSVHLHRLSELVLPVSDDRDSDAAWVQRCKQYARMSRTQLLKEIHPELRALHFKWPAEIQQKIKGFYCNPNLYATMAAEIENWTRCATEIGQAGGFPQVPMKVIGRDPDYSTAQAVDDGTPREEAELLERIWQELMEEQANLSKYGERITASGASHAVYEDRPDVVVDAIKDIVSVICHGGEAVPVNPQFNKGG